MRDLSHFFGYSKGLRNCEILTGGILKAGMRGSGNMSNHRATIQDVARMSGVSTATVSRVINRNGRYSAQTERRVREAIRQLGFVPNLAAKALRSRRSRLVGILVSHLSYEYVSGIVSKLEGLLFNQGFIGVTCNIGDNYDSEQTYLDALFGMNICALIVFSTGRQIIRPDGRAIPVIYINRTPENLNDPLCCSISTDSIDAGYKACSALIAAGCRRPAIVRTRYDISPWPREREVGFMKALLEHGCAYDASLSVTVPAYSQFGDVFACVGENLDRGLVADGYFCESDVYALGAIRSLETHGLRVPEDVKVVGCNDLSVALLNNRPITTIRHQTDTICAKAVENMRRMLDNKPLDKRHTVLGVELVSRETT